MEWVSKKNTQQGCGASSLVKSIAICSKFKPDHSFLFKKFKEEKTKKCFQEVSQKKERKKEKELTFHNNKTHLLNLPQKCGTKLKKQNLLYHSLFCWA